MVTTIVMQERPIAFLVWFLCLQLVLDIPVRHLYAATACIDGLLGRHKDIFILAASHQGLGIVRHAAKWVRIEEVALQIPERTKTHRQDFCLLLPSSCKAYTTTLSSPNSPLSFFLLLFLRCPDFWCWLGFDGSVLSSIPLLSGRYAAVQIVELTALGALESAKLFVCNVPHQPLRPAEHFGIRSYRVRFYLSRPRRAPMRWATDEFTESLARFVSYCLCSWQSH